MEVRVWDTFDAGNDVELFKVEINVATDNADSSDLDYVFEDSSGNVLYNTFAAAAGPTEVTKTFTIDAVLEKTGIITETFTVDAVLLKEGIITSTFTIDSVFVSQVTKDFTIDAVLLKEAVITETFTIDAVLFKAGIITETFTIDTILLKVISDETFTIDTVLLKVIADVTFTIDAVLLKTGVITETLTIDAVLEKLGVITETFTIDTVLASQPVLKTFTIDTILLKTGIITETFTIDAVLLKTGIITQTLTIDTILIKVIPKTFTIDVVLLKVISDETFTIDAILLKVIADETFTIDTVLEKTGIITETFTIDAILLKEVSDVTFTIDAVLLKTGIITETFTIDVVLSDLTVQTKTLTIDTVLLKTGITTETFTIDAVLDAAVEDGGGGGAGVGKSKQVGVSIYDRDASLPGRKRRLRPEWEFEVRAGVIVPQIAFEARARFRTIQKTKPFKVGAKLLTSLKPVIEGLIRYRTPNYYEMYYLAKFKRPELIGEWESKWSYSKIIKLLEKYIQIIDPKDTIKSFDFEENHSAWRILTERDTTAFTHSSSWIGHVIYDSDTQQMMIMMSGKRYLFCGVDDRTFDSFEGSPSKGEFYWRILKDLFTC